MTTNPTTSTLPSIIPALCTAFTEALPGGVKCHPVWPGPGATGEMVWLTQVTWDEYEDPVLKSGRRQRQEDYSVHFELIAIDKIATPANPTPALERGMVLFAALENVLADDAKLSDSGVYIQRAMIRPETAEFSVFENGFGYHIAGVVEVHARLL